MWTQIQSSVFQEQLIASYFVAFSIAHYFICCFSCTLSMLARDTHTVLLLVTTICYAIILIQTKGSFYSYWADTTFFFIFAIICRITSGSKITVMNSIRCNNRFVRFKIINFFSITAWNRKKFLSTWVIDSFNNKTEKRFSLWPQALAVKVL